MVAHIDERAFQARFGRVPGGTGRTARNRKLTSCAWIAGGTLYTGFFSQLGVRKRERCGDRDAMAETGARHRERGISSAAALDRLDGRCPTSGSPFHPTAGSTLPTSE